MSATATAGGKLIFEAVSQEVHDRTLGAAGRRRRMVSPEDGRAIEMLGHAIEYLEDEFALDCRSHPQNVVSGMHPQVAAIAILKQCNRVVYLSCPEVPALRTRIRAVLWGQRG